jgi:hypothetical protein
VDPLNDVRDPERRRADLRRILRQTDLPDTPRTTQRAIAAFILIAGVCCALAGLISWAARTADDVHATRTRVEELRPCSR